MEYMPILQMRLTNTKETYFLGNGGAGIQSQTCEASDLYPFFPDSAVHTAVIGPRKYGLPTSFPPRPIDIVLQARRDLPEA